MKKFIVIYHSPASAMEQSQEASSDDMQEAMKPWMEWAAKCGEGLVELGTPLADGQRLDTSGSSPSDRGVVGYSILQAEDMQGAKKLLEGHPHLAWTGGCEIEVHESIPM